MAHQRGSSTQRGYGAAHRAMRRQWQDTLDAGHTVTCARCGKRIYAGEAWDLGHTDDRKAWTGPEHPRCNRRAGGQNGARVSNTRRQTVVRRW